MAQTWISVQCNLSKPDPNGTKYFVRFRQDPDYSDLSFREEFCIVVALIMIKVCLLLDGPAYILHFISVVICFTYKEFAYLTLSSVFESNKALFRTRGRNSPVSVL